MKSADVRAAFLEFFAERGHSVVRSSGLVPQNDPTLFFTNSGMVQFKDVFTGQERRGYSRATTVQKCLRVSGKHNDLENVGVTPRHHTFFEMLGNFSFGDYFKEEAIAFAWELLTKRLKIDPNRLWITVYEKDDEALAIWRDKVGVPAARIQKLGEADNFWSMGDTGPCGPCTEIHYDHGPSVSDDERGPAFGDARYVEIWNLVFMQFERSADGTLTPLPRPSIDTGAGLERVAAVCQGVYSNYDTDLFTPLLAKGAELAGVTFGADPETDTALRVIADHSRAAAFLVADGVMPSNEERGYVLRRIMRRGIRYGVKVGLKPPFLHQTVATVIQHFGEAYPELRERERFILDVVRTEEERFAATLDRGMQLLEKAFEEHGKVLPGDVAFVLADTYGFPIDLTQLIAAERGATVDVAGFEALREEQRAKGRAAWKGSGEVGIERIWHALAEQHPTTFTGYSEDAGLGTARALVSEGAQVSALTEGAEGALVVDTTPFYAESGGQTGDTGTVRWEGGEAVVTDTTKPAGDLWVHHLRVTSGTLRVGDKVTLVVDGARRDRTRLNHTGTHLLHAALKSVLGEHVMQKGSLVGPERLRFDFSHHKAMTSDEVRAVEDLVNAEILRNHAVETRVQGIDEARKAGAMALFGEKYGESVRVVTVDAFSKELCGGTHARRSGDIGLFKITSESGIAAGVRRIEGQTGLGAHAWIREQLELARTVAGELKTTPERLLDSVKRLNDERARLQKELDTVRREAARAAAGDLASQAVVINGVKVLAVELQADAKTLRDEADRLRDQLGSCVVVLAAREGDDVRLLVAVSKDLAGSTFNAGKIIASLATMVGGKGGGRPDLAQAGGKDPAGIPGMLASVSGLLA